MKGFALSIWGKKLGLNLLLASFYINTGSNQETSRHHRIIADFYVKHQNKQSDISCRLSLFLVENDS